MFSLQQIESGNLVQNHQSASHYQTSPKSDNKQNIEGQWLDKLKIWPKEGFKQAPNPQRT